MSDTMRDPFEAWANREGFDVTSFRGEYFAPATEGAWAAWQAAQSQPSPHAVSNIKIIADPSIPKGEAVFRLDGKEVGRITNIAAPAPPVPQTVQEIMRLMNPYISACVDAGVNNVTGRMSLQFEADVAKIEATFQPLHAALTALVEKNHELQFSLDGVNAMREPLTDEQRKDLVAAAFYIAAKDDEHACLKCDDAERIVEVLCAIAEFEPPTNHGTEPEQGDGGGV